MPTARTFPNARFEGIPSIVPMRIVPETTIESRDPDPRGMKVVGADGTAAGTVKDVWVDRAEALIRYLEVELRRRQARRCCCR